MNELTTIENFSDPTANPNEADEFRQFAFGLGQKDVKHVRETGHQEPRFPKASILGGGGGPSAMVLEFRRRQARSDLSYRAEFSESLGPQAVWTTEEFEDVYRVEDGWEYVRVYAPPSMGESKTGFGRVRVESAQQP